MIFIPRHKSTAPVLSGSPRGMTQRGLYQRGITNHSAYMEEIHLWHCGNCGAPKERNGKCKCGVEHAR